MTIRRIVEQLQVLTESSDYDRLAKRLATAAAEADFTTWLYKADLFSVIKVFDAFVDSLKTGVYVSTSALRTVLYYGDHGANFESGLFTKDPGLKRDLEKLQKDLAAQDRLHQRAKIKPGDLKKGAQVQAFHKGEEISGTIQWIGPDKFKKGVMRYGIATDAGGKLVFVAEGDIFSSFTPPQNDREREREKNDKDFKLASRDHLDRLRRGKGDAWRGFGNPWRP